MLGLCKDQAGRGQSTASERNVWDDIREAGGQVHQGRLVYAACNKLQILEV